MKRKVIFTGLLVVLLSSPGQMEAKGFGHMGGRGFAHFGEKRGFAFGYGHFGYHKLYSRGFGYGLPFYGSSFYSSSFPFGYYIPFYGSPDLGTPIGRFGYYEENNSPSYSGKISKPEVCRDSWTDQRRPDSLSGVINSVFRVQCENGHPATEPDHPREHSQD